MFIQKLNTVISNIGFSQCLFQMVNLYYKRIIQYNTVTFVLQKNSHVLGFYFAQQMAQITWLLWRRQRNTVNMFFIFLFFFSIIPNRALLCKVTFGSVMEEIPQTWSQLKNGMHHLKILDNVCVVIGLPWLQENEISFIMHFIGVVRSLFWAHHVGCKQVGQFNLHAKYNMFKIFLTDGLEVLDLSQSFVCLICLPGITYFFRIFSFATENLQHKFKLKKNPKKNKLILAYFFVHNHFGLFRQFFLLQKNVYFIYWLFIFFISKNYW